MTEITSTWEKVLKEELNKPYFKELEQFLEQEYATQTIYPAKENVFNALNTTPYEEVKVVILGQDPYHGEGQAHGLSFSVQKGITPPPSLKNIYKELASDLGCTIPTHGDLTKWAKQGVLLLNTVLTVREGQPNSHKGKGWEKFTDKVIEKLNERQQPLVFLLWGGNARAKKKLITSPQHLVLESAHPSPLSAYHGFLGCGHFSKVNNFLIEQKISPIDWQIY